MKRKIKKNREKLFNNLAYQFSADIGVEFSADAVQEHYNIVFSADERKIIRDFLCQMYSKNITDIKRLDALMQKMTQRNLPNISYVQEVMIFWAKYFLSFKDFLPTDKTVEQADLKIDNKKSTC